MSIWTPPIRCSENADSPQHRTAGWCFIDWKEVEQRELLAEAERLLETGQPRSLTRQMPTPKPEDSEPEAHVMEPLADDHSSDSDDTPPTGIEESAAPETPKRTVLSLLERLQSNPYHIRDQATIMTALCFCVVHKMSSASPSARVHVRVNRVVVVCCCMFLASSIACTQNRVK